MLCRRVLRRFAALGVGLAVLGASGSIYDDKAKYQELLAQSLRPPDLEFAQEYLELLRNEKKWWGDWSLSYGVVQCLRSPLGAATKVLWLIGMLAGITRVSLNWTTGEFDMMVLSINVPPASVSKGKPYAPMILSASLPIVPRVFFFRRTQIRPLIVATEK